MRDPWLLNKCINYITQSRSGKGVNQANPLRMACDLPIYEVITMQGGTSFKIVRLDVYPPRTIATFKPRLYVKAKNGYRTVSSVFPS
jgi:hypothetical protein